MQSGFDDEEFLEEIPPEIEAIANSEELSVERAAARAENIAGMVARRTMDPATAIEHFENSVSASRRIDYVQGEVAALNNLAKTLAAAGNQERAMDLTQSALAKIEETGDRYAEAALHNSMSDYWHELGQDDEARRHLDKAIVMLAQIQPVDGRLSPGIWAREEWLA